MDSDTFADRLLSDRRVAVAPGATFGSVAGKYIRISMAAEDSVVGEGLERICAYINAIA
jgi:aspartate/methionine/tyrosine aminotransferase